MALPKRDVNREIDTLIAQVNKRETITESKTTTLAEKQTTDSLKVFRENSHGIESMRHTKQAFLKETKAMLLGECLHMIYAKALNNIIGEGVYSMDDSKRVIAGYIAENGADKLLLDMQYKSILLSEINQVVEKHYASIQEACKDKECEAEIKVPEECKDKFYDDLDMIDVDDVVFQISSRVTDSIDEFITTNTLNKENIKEILKGSSEKLQNTKSDVQKESVERIAGVAIHGIKNDGRMNLFSALTENTVQGIVKDVVLRETFMEGASLDMERIVNACKLTYTLMEMTNTIKLESFDDAKVLDIIKSIK